MEKSLWRRVRSRFGKILNHDSGGDMVTGIRTGTLQLFLAAILVLASAGYGKAAQSAEMQDFLNRVQNASDGVTSFYSEFTQEKHLAMFDTPVQFSGRLAIIRPDKLRWEFVQPVPSVLIFNGDKGLRCSDQAEPEYFSLKTDPVMRLVAEQLWYWMGGNYQQMSDRYNLTYEPPATLGVAPKDKKEAEYLKGVKISFEPDTLQPQQVEIYEGGNDTTRMVFLEPLLNSDLPDEYFNECSAGLNDLSRAGSGGSND